jgi:5'-nucleotidase
MLILITNDDGIHSEGLRTLINCASLIGRTVTIVPQGEMSGASHAITLRNPLRVQKIENDIYTVTGTPTDCVYLGIHHVLNERPDMVLSGINRGPNLGFDVVYSGTVQGAMEGLIQGIPSAAISLAGTESFPFDQIRTHVADILEEIKKSGIPKDCMLNINIPPPDSKPIKGKKITRLGRRFYSNDIITRVDPRGGEYLWIGGSRVEMDKNPDTDCGSVQDGYISITPLKLDFTSWEVLNNGWGGLFKNKNE